MGVVWVQLAGTHPALKHCFKLKPLEAIFNKFLHNKKRFPNLVGRSPNDQVNPIITLTSHYRLEQNIKCLNLICFLSELSLTFAGQSPLEAAWKLRAILDFLVGSTLLKSAYIGHILLIWTSTGHILPKWAYAGYTLLKWYYTGYTLLKWASTGL